MTFLFIPNYLEQTLKLSSELKTLAWDVLNPDRSINLEIIITRGEQALFNLEIKKNSGSSINPDIHHSKVPGSVLFQRLDFSLF